MSSDDAPGPTVAAPAEPEADNGSDTEDVAPTTNGEDADPGSQAPDPVTFECWDGTQVETAQACAMPAGSQGMAWIFPDSMRRECQGGQGSARRNVSVWCYLPTADTHYSEWKSVGAAETEYGYNQVSTPAPRWQGYTRWNIAARDGSYKVALVHPQAPFSVTLYADSIESRDQALRELELRPVRDARGRRLD